MKLYHKRYGAGPPLVILHGLLGASGNWHTLSRNVFGERFTVYAVDQRNHGRSPHADRFDYPAMVADLAAFLDEEGLDAVHLLGHSMGGKTAMHFARAHPERVDRLVVVDIAPRAYPPGHLDILEALRAVDPGAYGSRKEIDDALAKRVPNVGVRQFLLKNLALDAGTYSWQMNLDALYAHYDEVIRGLEGDATFDGPALFVRGERSDYVTADDEAPIRRLFPAAEFVTIPRAGHWVHAEAPGPFAEAVMAFLA